MNGTYQRVNHEEEFEISLGELFEIVWKGKWLIIGMFIVAVVGMYFYVQRLEPIYQTSATIMIESDASMDSLFNMDVLGGGQADKATTYSRILTSRSMLSSVIEKLNLKDDEGQLLKPGALKSVLSVSQINGTDLIEISLEDTDPARGQEILNTLIALFEDQNVEMNRSSLAGTYEFVESQKQEVENDLRQIENKLLSYKMENDILSPGEEGKQLLEKLLEIEKAKSMVEIETDSLKLNIEETRKQLGEVSEEIISSTMISKNPLISQYKGKIVDLESRLAALESQYTENHPEIISLKAELDVIMVALTEEVEKQVSSQTTSTNPLYQALYQQLIQWEINLISSEAQISAYNEMMKEYENELEKLPNVELGLVRLERQATITGEIYTMLMTRAEELKISQAMITSEIYVVDSANLPRSPVKPNKKMLLAIAGLLGLMVGMGIVFLLNMLDTKVKTEEEVRKLTGLPVLGSIPDMKKFKS